MLLRLHITEDLPGLVDACNQSVDVALVVVHVERSARRRRYVEPPHQWLRAMMAGANANALTVENRRQIVGMHVAEGEAQNSAPLAGRRAIDMEALDRREPFLRRGHQRSLVRAPTVHATLVEILDHRGETDGIGRVRCPGLYLVRQHVP